MLGALRDHSFERWRGEKALKIPLATADHKILSILSFLGPILFALLSASAIGLGFFFDTGLMPNPLPLLFFTLIISSGAMVPLFLPHLTEMLDGRKVFLNARRFLEQGAASAKTAMASGHSSVPEALRSGIDDKLIGIIKEFEKETGWQVVWTKLPNVLAKADAQNKRIIMSIGWVLASPEQENRREKYLRHTLNILKRAILTPDAPEETTGPAYRMIGGQLIEIPAIPPQKTTAEEPSKEARALTALRQMSIFRKVLTQTKGQTLGISPDGRWWAVKGDNNKLKIINPHAQESIELPYEFKDTTALSFSPDSNLLNISMRGKGDKLFNLETRQEIKLPPGWIANNGFSPDSRYVFIQDENHDLVYDLRAKKLVADIYRHGKTEFAFSPDSKFAVIFAETGQDAQLVNLRTKEVFNLKDKFNIHAAKAVFSPDSKLLAVQTREKDGAVKILDLESMREAESPITTESASEINFIEFSQDSRLLIVYYMDYSLGMGAKIYNLKEKRLNEIKREREISRIVFSISRIVFSPDLKTAFVGRGNNKIEALELETMRKIDLPFINPDDIVIAARFSPDSRLLVLDYDRPGKADRTQYMTIYDPQAGREIKTIKEVRRLFSFSPDSRYGIIFNRDDSTAIVDLQKDKTVKLPADTEIIFADFSADSKFLILRRRVNNDDEPSDLALNLEAWFDNPFVEKAQRIWPRQFLRNLALMNDLYRQGAMEEKDLRAGNWQALLSERFLDLYREGKTPVALSKITFEDGGDARNNYAAIMEKIYASLAPRSHERPRGLPVLEPVDAQEAALIGSLSKIAGDKTLSGIYGRTMVYRDAQAGAEKTAVHVKLLKEGEDPSVLAYEYELMNFLAAKKDEWGLKGQYPRGKLRIGKIKAENLPQSAIQNQSDKEKPVKINIRDGYACFMAYEVDLADGKNPFTVYINDPALSHEEFLEAFRINAHDRLVMASHGLFDMEIIELFHNQEHGGGRGYDWMVDVNNPTWGRQGAGRLNDFVGSTLYPNIRKSGPADFASIRFIKDLITDENVHMLADNRISRLG
ncbi:MAG: WD40 repeat domain-containing protein, partial [Elusimicrobia bacterium]|nr:WD40 repeat domain-containing protein [Elusimicrobiota bacterium]